MSNLAGLLCIALSILYFSIGDIQTTANKFTQATVQIK